MTAKPPDPAALLRRLPVPELDADHAEDDDLRRIELRRVILEIAEIDHAAEIAEVTAAVTRLRRATRPPAGPDDKNRPAAAPDDKNRPTAGPDDKDQPAGGPDNKDRPSTGPGDKGRS